MASSTKSIFTFKYVDAAETIAMGVTLPLVCMGIVASRFYTRTRQSVQPGIDDWLILGGVICLIGMGACIIDGAARHAMGYPTPMPPKTATKAELLEYNPPSTELIGKAIGHTSEEGLTASDLILDVFLLVLPLPSIWTLRMTVTRKLQVSFIMILGLSAIAASIARLVLYVQLEKAALAQEEVDQNPQKPGLSFPTEVLTLSMYWSTLESGLAIIAACLPSLSSLFTAKSLQSAVHSVRSVLSLRSSQGSSKGSSRRDGTANAYADLERSSSSSSSAGFTKPGLHGDLSAKYDLQTFELAKGERKQGDSLSTQS
ncbi:uncharacterized protein KY384_008426 [Bacidia gigantensis]|uniref:uncharacterized protein n=1 Tax=Bacidia gigantensis TaxID=2732470 RepID=UPI001D03F94F|nr:uncharacterized protein KY384_008426 [Bacidia gigantensis]KAG8526997.1 hypothetical protein KY384_008426 [Bacidia gigantensis]